jgi:hypothetical protein
MNKEKLTWEAPQLLLADVHATLSGGTPDHAEFQTISYYPTSGVG